MKMIIVLHVSGKDVDGKPVPDARAAAALKRWALDLLTEDRNNEVDAQKGKGLWAVTKAALVVHAEMEP